MNKAVKDFQEFYGLDKLIEQENQLNLSPDDITVARLVKRTQWNKRRVLQAIDKWENEGRLEHEIKRNSPVVFTSAGEFLLAYGAIPSGAGTGNGNLQTRCAL
jgi:hypothetical protein